MASPGVTSESVRYSPSRVALHPRIIYCWLLIGDFHVRGILVQAHLVFFFFGRSLQSFINSRDELLGSVGFLKRGAASSSNSLAEQMRDVQNVAKRPLLTNLLRQTLKPPSPTDFSRSSVI